ncbi:MULTISPECIES: PilZ domain-containing protein [unclassified Roseibium]|uniref:PilZ domain-containing protein n=1 Tax=unclassified Roseibium TaxID=2629323 RepID=UPI0031793FDF
MKPEDKLGDLSHLLDQPDAEEDVLIVDFDTMSVIDAVISNVNEWGCRIASAEIKELYKNIGIRAQGSNKLVKALVTSAKKDFAVVVFAKSEQTVSDKRREKRNNVNIAAKLSDLEGITEITGTIVDAGNNGCRIMADGMTALPEEVVLTMKKFDRPVIAEFAWRNEASAGLRLLWDRTLEENEKA